MEGRGKGAFHLGSEGKDEDEVVYLGVSVGEAGVEQGKEGKSGRGQGEGGRTGDRGRDTQALLFRYMWPSRQKGPGKRSSSPSLGL